MLLPKFLSAFLCSWYAGSDFEDTAHPSIISGIISVCLYETTRRPLEYQLYCNNIIYWLSRKRGNLSFIWTDFSSQTKTLFNELDLHTLALFALYNPADSSFGRLAHSRPWDRSRGATALMTKVGHLAHLERDNGSFLPVGNPGVIRRHLTTLESLEISHGSPCLVWLRVLVRLLGVLLGECFELSPICGFCHTIRSNFVWTR